MVKHIPHSRPTSSSREARAAYEVILSGNLAQGKKVKEFEEKFSAFQRIKSCAATNSGTSALHLALMALKIKKGDEIIIPSYVCAALLNAVRYLGAKAKIVDVNYDDFNISIESIKKNLARKTKAIIVPHMFGQAADIFSLLAFGVPLIEDCAQALGAQYNGKPVGGFGALSIYSFYATKMMTTGEGGMVASNNQSLIDKIKDLREYDHKSIYRTCYNYKMTDIQAAMGIVQLAQLPSWIKKRKEIAHQYNESLLCNSCILPIQNPQRTHVFYRYILKVKKNKKQFMEILKEKRITCAEPVYTPLHRYLKLKNFSNTELLMKEAVSIPIYPSLKDLEIKHICKNLQLCSNSL